MSNICEVCKKTPKKFTDLYKWMVIYVRIYLNFDEPRQSVFICPECVSEIKDQNVVEFVPLGESND